MVKSRARAAARLPLRGGNVNLRCRTRRRELRDRSEESFPKRQRTGAVQKLAPARTGRECAKRFGLRQSSGAFGWFLPGAQHYGVSSKRAGSYPFFTIDFHSNIGQAAPVPF